MDGTYESLEWRMLPITMLTLIAQSSAEGNALPWLTREVYGNSLLRWLIAVGVFVAAAVVLRIAKAFVARRTEELAKRTVTQWDDAMLQALKATKLWFLLLLALYVASLFLTLPLKTKGVIESMTIVALLIQVAIWGNVLITFAINGYAQKRRETDAEAVTTVWALSFLAKVALWSIVALLALDNLGVDVKTLIAGLGIGGIAVALAAQNILGDLFASLSIVLDKPFVLGDFIIVGDQMGTVEKIGLKTTRLRSLSGEQLIFSNNDLLKSRIRNFKRMQERRVDFRVSVTYDTPREKLAAIPKMIREIIEASKSTRFDRCHFKEYGESGLIFETVYFVLSADYNVYMDIHQNVNLAIYDRFRENAIEFAYPTRTLLIRQAPVEAAGPGEATARAISGVLHQSPMSKDARLS